MEDRCVICGDAVAEGTWVCPTCKLANSGTPCRLCGDRKEGCHIYCTKYLAYFNARKRVQELEQRNRKADEYYITKTKDTQEVMKRKGVFG